MVRITVAGDGLHGLVLENDHAAVALPIALSPWWMKPDTTSPDFCHLVRFRFAEQRVYQARAVFIERRAQHMRLAGERI